jgi:CRISPR-associated protein Cas5t
MTMRLHLRVRAPFAAFRPFQAGSYRSTWPVMPPSAAYGLVLNLAGIEMREPGDATTRIRADAPRARIAVGIVRAAEVASLYHQLHSYPVGTSGKELAERTYGAKYWIAPVRREILVGYDGVVAVDGPSEILDRVAAGLAGRLDEPRYGLPFAGDNNFLFDEIAIARVPALWYARIDGQPGPVRGSTRLSIGIDREDNSKTTLGLFAPGSSATEEPPEGAWQWVPTAPS